MNQIRYSLHGYIITATVREFKATWTAYEVQGSCPICHTKITVGKKMDERKKSYYVSTFKGNMKKHFKDIHNLK